MKHINVDLAAVALQAKRMRRVEAGVKLLQALFIGLLLSIPLFYQMGVDNGWWRD